MSQDLPDLLEKLDPQESWDPKDLQDCKERRDWRAKRATVDCQVLKEIRDSPALKECLDRKVHQVYEVLQDHR